MKKRERVNHFAASDWFDMNFFEGFLSGEFPIKEMFNEQKHTIGDEIISSRVLNHWYEMGIVEDNRPNGKGWKKFSFSEIVWIHIISKLRKFGLNLQSIKRVKDQLDIYNIPGNQSRCPLLDFYMSVVATSKIPIKVIVFESGQAEIVRQIAIDISNELDMLSEDFISIDLNKLMDKLLAKKDVKADYFNYNVSGSSILAKEIEQSILVEDISSITVKVKGKEYQIDKEFFTLDKPKALALMKMLDFGEMVEKKHAGKSTYTVTNKEKRKKG